MRMTLSVHATGVAQGARIRFRSLGNLAAAVLELANVVQDGNDYGRMLMKVSSVEGAVGAVVVEDVEGAVVELGSGIQIALSAMDLSYVEDQRGLDQGIYFVQSTTFIR